MVSLAFVAHQDDDLLFLNPAIAKEVQTGDTGWIVYLTAGNIDRGPDCKQYADSRADGSRAAWARALKVDKPVWATNDLKVGTRALTRNTLTSPNGGTVHLVHTFISAAAGDDNGDLYYMWTRPAYSATPIDKRPSYDRASFLELLKGLISLVSPVVLRTQDPQGLQQGDHIDHVHAARFALTANLDSAGHCVRPAETHFCYIMDSPRVSPNVEDKWAKEKLDIWHAYIPHDKQVPQGAWDVMGNRQYRRDALQPGDRWSADPL